MSAEALMEALRRRFPGGELQRSTEGEITLEVKPEGLQEVCLLLRDDSVFAFDMLIDICGVDYLHYGESEWQTHEASETGFDRAVDVLQGEALPAWIKGRFAAVYHLLSISHNQRLRLRVFVEGEVPMVPSVVNVWSAANWFEREAFDLMGIVFEGHPDLRRILTDYGFMGHPFRKDFPLIGEVEMRYDASVERVVYEPVQIEPRILVPRVIRKAKSLKEGSVP